MRASYDLDTGRLRLVFDEAAEAERFAADVEREAGFVVELGHRLALHDVVTVALTVDATSGDLPARVAQVFDKGFGKFGTALLFEEPQAPRRLVAEMAAGENGAENSDPESLPDAPEPADAATTGEMRGTSPIHRIKQMNPRQRALLATKAGRTERQILLRDNSPQVLQNLLNNPRIEAEEILQIARSSHVVAPILQRLATDTRWNGNLEMMALVARNPRTPSQFASRLMPSLRTSDLRIMAKMSSGLKELVRKAALREYLKRTGRRI